MEEISIEKFREVRLMDDGHVFAYLWSLQQSNANQESLNTFKKCIEEYRCEDLKQQETRFLKALIVVYNIQLEGYRNSPAYLKAKKEQQAECKWKESLCYKFLSVFRRKSRKQEISRPKDTLPKLPKISIPNDSASLSDILLTSTLLNK